MNNNIPEIHNVSLQRLSKHVNNVNLNEEILVVEGYQLGDKGGDKEYFPLRLDALIIILVREGNFRIGIDLNEYEAKKDCLIVIQPQNYICLLEADDSISVDMVICSRRIIEQILPKLTDILPLLIHHRTTPVNQLTSDESAGLRSFHNFLLQKLEGERTPFLQQKVLCVLQAALYEMMDIAAKSKESQPVKGNRKKEIMANFILAVCESFREERQISYYANKLCITPKHLSAVVKELSKRTASEWIENYVTMEAKILLRSTDLTIQEIAQKLNFSNQSFFGKYFKHQTGMSPTDFRKKVSSQIP